MARIGFLFVTYNEKQPFILVCRVQLFQKCDQNSRLGFTKKKSMTRPVEFQFFGNTHKEKMMCGFEVEILNLPLKSFLTMNPVGVKNRNYGNCLLKDGR